MEIYRYCMVFSVTLYHKHFVLTLAVFCIPHINGGILVVIVVATMCWVTTVYLACRLLFLDNLPLTGEGTVMPNKILDNSNIALPLPWKAQHKDMWQSLTSLPLLLDIYGFKFFTIINNVVTTMCVYISNFFLVKVIGREYFYSFWYILPIAFLKGYTNLREWLTLMGKKIEKGGWHFTEVTFEPAHAKWVGLCRKLGIVVRAFQTGKKERAKAPAHKRAVAPEESVHSPLLICHRKSSSFIL